MSEQSDRIRKSYLAVVGTDADMVGAEPVAIFVEEDGELVPLKEKVRLSVITAACV